MIRILCALLLAVSLYSVPTQGAASTVLAVTGGGSLSFDTDAGDFFLGAPSEVTYSSGSTREGQFGMAPFSTRASLNSAIGGRSFFGVSVSNGAALLFERLTVGLDRGETNRPPRQFALLVNIDNTGFQQVGPVFDREREGSFDLVWDLTGLDQGNEAEFRVYGWGGVGGTNEQRSVALEGDVDPVTGDAIVLEASVVPLPSGLSLLLAGIGSLVVLKRRRQSA